MEQCDVMRNKYCEGCLTCREGGNCEPLIKNLAANEYGRCPCTNCIVKGMCCNPCGEYNTFKQAERIKGWVDYKGKGAERDG